MFTMPSGGLDSEAISNVGTFHLAEGRIIAAKAREVVAANGLGDRIKLIARHSTELRIGPDLSERAQVLVTEVFGTSAINELVIPTSALLHRQPTPGSIAAAERQLGEVSPLKVEVVDAAMASARKADLAGDKRACEQALAEVQRELGLSRPADLPVGNRLGFLLLKRHARQPQHDLSYADTFSYLIDGHVYLSDCNLYGQTGSDAVYPYNEPRTGHEKAHAE
jgi:hypothetical protein